MHATILGMKYRIHRLKQLSQLCTLSGCIFFAVGIGFASSKTPNKTNSLGDTPAKNTPIVSDIELAQEVSYELSGLKKHPELLKNAQERLKIMRKQFPNDLDATDVDDMAKQGTKEIALALQPYGYFHPEITHSTQSEIKKSLKTKHNKQFWTVNYKIKLGPKVIIKTVNITISGDGKNNDPLKQLANHSPIQPKQIFTSQAYNKTQSLLFSTAHNQGYLEAEITQHEIQINLEKNQANVFITLNTGPKFYYGPVSFTKTPYSTDFLRKFINFKQGETYSPDTLQDLQSDLTNTKYFSSVAVLPNIKQAKLNSNDQVPIEIKTQAVKSQQYKFGVGYGTNTGPRTSVGVDLFRITDTGQHLTAMFNISKVATGISSKYYIPGSQPAINQYTIGANLGQFKPDSGDAYFRKFSTGYDTQLAPLWHSSSNLNFLHERFSINDDPYHTSDLLYPSFHLTRLKANNPINPENGTRLTINTSFGGPASTTDFAKGDMSGKLIYPTSQYNYVILRGEIGALTAHNYQNEFPLSQRYFAGGINSIRGYTYQSIGPGRFKKIVSTEFDQKIIGDFYTGVFIDAGTASDHINESLQRGIGVAFIYRTSVGPINFNIAQANTDPDKPLRIEFSFGASL